MASLAVCPMQNGIPRTRQALEWADRLLFSYIIAPVLCSAMAASVLG